MSKQRRPFLGIVVLVNGSKYYIPLSCIKCMYRKTLLVKEKYV
ncbi:MAG: type III toxin-antitoxin system ToxN/AbiQ family toxin [Lachnospiraceae bacterium]|nr:type III toxin-antitoxin system ToxN/AbiQ family toxin [Lachnospiraceae bacterium]